MTWLAFRPVSDILAECRWLRSELRADHRHGEMLCRRLRVLREYLAFIRQNRNAMRRAS